MLNDVYNSPNSRTGGQYPPLGRLPAPGATATAHSKLCGSTVTVDLKTDGDEVTDFAHDVKACALGQASSSIMARHVIGAKPAELRELRETVRKMLKENGPPPTGKWADIAVLEPVRDYKARHASTMLTFDAVVSALDQIEAKAAKTRSGRLVVISRQRNRRSSPAAIRPGSPAAYGNSPRARQILRSAGIAEPDAGNELRRLRS